jgi:hypothetical protein
LRSVAVKVDVFKMQKPETKIKQREKSLLWWSKHPQQKEVNSNIAKSWWKNHPERKPKKSKICSICGKIFFRKGDGKKQWENRKYCSRECFLVSLK